MYRTVTLWYVCSHAHAAQPKHIHTQNSNSLSLSLALSLSHTHTHTNKQTHTNTHYCSNDMEPFITLHHFVEPDWFVDIGGFEDEENVSWFTEYAAFAARYERRCLGMEVLGRCLGGAWDHGNPYTCRMPC